MSIPIQTDNEIKTKNQTIMIEIKINDRWVNGNGQGQIEY